MKGNRNTTLSRMHGISLTEGLVALVVLTVGLLALFNFQAGLLSSGAEAKARTEALQLADSKLGNLRTQSALAYGSETAFVADASNIFAGSQAVSGTNADFTVTWSDTDDSNPVRKTVAVVVSWTDKEGSKQVQLNGDVRWRDPKLGVALLAKTLPNGGTITSPQGGAEYSDESYAPGSIPSGTANTNEDGSSDGTQVYYNSDKGRYELIDTSGNILLTSSQDFSVIEGKVFVDAGMHVDMDHIQVGAPDISWCTTTHNPSPNDRVAVSGTTVFYYASYRCYMGAGWYGSIGPQIINIDSTSTPQPSEVGPNDVSCVGEPGVADDGTADSRHPQLSFLRTYRGYEPLVNASGERQYDANGNRLYESSGLPQGDSYSGQDFYLNTIASATDSDCGSASVGMAQKSDEFLDNPGSFVCLTASCPDVLPTDTTAAVTSANTWTITGQISGGTIASIITSDGDACTVNAADYSCDVYDLGTGWTGYIDATAGTNYAIINGTRRTFTNVTANDSSSSNDFSLEPSGSVTLLTVSGTISTLTGGAFSALTTNNSGTCITQTTGAGTPKAGSYSCTYANFSLGNDISLNFTTTDHVCSTSGTVSGNSVWLSNVTGDQTGINVDIQTTTCP